MSGRDNETDRSIKRRKYLKGLTASGVAVAGFGGLSAMSTAQDGDLSAPFCGEASTPPETPPGGQAGQCINCVREECESEPVAVALFSGGLSGQCFTLSPEEIPDDADYITLKAGEYCFLGEVPEDPQEDVTWCIEQSNGQPEMLPDISNATLYACPDEEPPLVDDVDVTCAEIVITTSNIEDGETLDVTVEFSDGSSEDYEPTVTDNQATVTLPGDRDPVHLRIEYGGAILFDEGVTASDAPCGEGPAVTDVAVTCTEITIQTANIDEGETLDVTVTFTDDSMETYMPEVDADGVAVVELPGDRDPAHLLVEYDGMVLFDQSVAASDAPCVVAPECPPDLNIAFKYKYGMWWPDTYDDIGEEVDPDVFSIEGDRKEVTICGPYQFAVAYATRGTKRDDGHHHDDDKKEKRDGGHHHGDDKKRKNGDDGKKKSGDGHHHDDDKKEKRDDGHHHGDDRKRKNGSDDGKKKHGGWFEGCEEQDPVLTEADDGQFCATITSAADEKSKKAEICWFRVYCPENGNGNDGNDNNDGNNDDGNGNGNGNGGDGGC